MIDLLRQLWRDEAGYLLSAEAVTLGTLGVAGATVGMGAMSKSVNHELTESAYAIRSLDQSFFIPEQQGSGAWTAGSAFRQTDAEAARAELSRYIEERGGTPIDFAQRDNRTDSVAPTEEPHWLAQRQFEPRLPEDREEQRRALQRKRQERRLQQEWPEAASPTDAE